MASVTGEGEQSSSRKNCRVYVGNLAWRVSWQDLKDHLRECNLNAIRVDVFSDGQGRSRGCGLVEFATPEEAALCIDKVTDTELLGRQIFVREDKEDSTGFRGGSGNGSGNGGGNFRGNSQARGGRSAERGRGFRASPGRPARRSEPTEPTSVVAAPAEQIYVGNLAWRTTADELRAHFAGIGEIVACEIAVRDGRSRGWGTVTFATADQANQAVAQLNESTLDGRPILVKLDQGRKVF